MTEPIAYFVTWTIRGSWLAGNRRGSVDRDHNLHGHPLLAENPAREAALRSKTQDEPLALTGAARALVRGAIETVCEHRGWILHAANVRSNHVHLVVTSPGYEPERVMQQMKSWSTRALRESKYISADQQPWTRHGSTRYLWDAGAVELASRYVLEFQDGPRAYARGSEGPASDASQ